MSIQNQFKQKKSEQNLELLNRIQELKKKKNAVILAHYYQEDSIQEIADFLGDSLNFSIYFFDESSKCFLKDFDVDDRYR